ncbi:MAG: zinc ribbon domain-containing protein [Sedimentisphaerales bacterium]|nr:zinc ribbon domain-containing protein [Sedimentisphaerales bacterium]
MPTYEYRCERCEYEFEKFQSITAGVLRKCPKCGKNSLKRLIGTGAGVIFKGSGFYQTDYRSESYKQAETKEKDARTPKGDQKKSEKKETKASDKTKPKSKSKPKDD